MPYEETNKLLKSMVEELDKFYGLFSDHEDPCESFEQAKAIWNDLKKKLADNVEARRSQFSMLKAIREAADTATGIDRGQNDPRPSGAIGAVKLLVEKFNEVKADRDEADNAMRRQTAKIEELQADRQEPPLREAQSEEFYSPE